MAGLTVVMRALVSPICSDASVAQLTTGRIVALPLTANRCNELRQHTLKSQPGTHCHGLDDHSQLSIRELVDILGCCHVRRECRSAISRRGHGNRAQTTWEEPKHCIERCSSTDACGCTANQRHTLLFCIAVREKQTHPQVQL